MMTSTGLSERHREHAFATSREPHAIQIFRERRPRWRSFWFILGIGVGACAQILWGAL